MTGRQGRLPGVIKVGFVLLSNTGSPLPSTRIAVLNVMEPLRQAGFAPEIVYEPPAATETPDLGGLANRVIGEGFDVVCLQKVHGAAVIRFAKVLSAQGIKTVYLVCDRVDAALAEATDSTVAVTAHLKSLYPAALRPKIHVVHDGVERPAVQKTQWRPGRGSDKDPLRAVLVTSSRLDTLPVIGLPPSWLSVTVVGRYPRSRWQQLRAAQWEFRQQRGWAPRLAWLHARASPRLRFVPWEAEAVYRELLDADIGIIPIDRRPEESPGQTAPDWAVKSENRLTLKMSIGLPVVATPIPAYEPVIEQGRNGFLADGPAEWLACLQDLRDPARRRAIGERARADALRRFSIELQAQQLGHVLRSTLASRHDTA